MKFQIGAFRENSLLCLTLNLILGKGDVLFLFFGSSSFTLKTWFRRKEGKVFLFLLLLLGFFLWMWKMRVGKLFLVSLLNRNESRVCSCVDPYTWGLGWSAVKLWSTQPHNYKKKMEIKENCEIEKKIWSLIFFSLHNKI